MPVPDSRFFRRPPPSYILTQLTLTHFSPSSSAHSGETTTNPPKAKLLRLPKNSSGEWEEPEEPQEPQGEEE